MSIRLMTLAWDCDLSGNDKLVLLALADWANDDGHCWPSIAKLCAKTRASERTVQGIIKELVEAGHLTRQEVPGRGCNYLVHPRNICTPAEVAPPQELRDTPAEVAPNTLKKHHIPPKPPLSAQPPRRRQRREELAAVEPIVTSKPNEGWEATEFRRLAAEGLGDGPYRNLIQPCHLARLGDDLVLQAPSETLRDCLASYRSRLGPIVRQVGCVALRVEVVPSGNRHPSDPKVADAARQAEAIRGGRVAGAALPTGGLGRG